MENYHKYFHIWNGLLVLFARRGLPLYPDGVVSGGWLNRR